MQVGFHFDTDHEGLGTFYGDVIQKEVFKALATLNGFGLLTKLYHGDLRLNSLAMDWEKTGSGRVGTLNQRKYLDGFIGWLIPALIGWARFPLDSMLRCIHRNIYVIYLDSISSQTAEGLHRKLEVLPYYFGALEINESSPEHRVLYPGSLLPLCRITDMTVSIFREGYEGEDLDLLLAERCRQSGFTNVRYEVFNEIVFTERQASRAILKAVNPSSARLFSGRGWRLPLRR